MTALLPKSDIAKIINDEGCGLLDPLKFVETPDWIDRIAGIPWYSALTLVSSRDAPSDSFSVTIGPARMTAYGWRLSLWGEAAKGITDARHFRLLDGYAARRSACRARRRRR